MKTIGFVIVSYAEPKQLLQLASRIDSMFPGTAISCAHDFGQTPLDQGGYPKSVSFVRPHIDTQWGHISVIHAAMHALRQLYERDDPDWFVQLSGSDYPVATTKTILDELESGGYDAYLDHREVAYQPKDHEADLNGFDRREWGPLSYDRYVAGVIRYPSVTKRLRPTMRRLVIRHPWLAWPFHPFRANLRCFGGDFWIIANRRVARVLLDEYENGKYLIKHFSKCFIPEEAFYHTVICNQPSLRISKDNKRYSDWSRGGPHPKVLDMSDLPAIAESGAYFARKFEPGSPALALLDRMIDQK